MPRLYDLNEPVGETVLQVESVCVKNRAESFGKGKLFIAEDAVFWIRPDRQGFILSYPNITLHAISKDLNAFPEECLYVIVDLGNDDEDEEEQDTSMGDENGESENFSLADHELLLIPDDKSLLQAMFDAFSQCQALHPDPADVNSSDDDDQEEHGNGIVVGADGGGDLMDADASEEQFEEDEEGAEGDNQEGMPPHYGGGDAC